MSEIRIPGHCKCGRAVIKVLNSEVSGRLDGIRYADPEDIDSSRWCILRCRSCYEPIDQAFVASEVQS